MFLCFALGAVWNIIVVLNSSASALGEYTGYFLGKNYLGEFATPAVLLAIHETFYPGFRRIIGIVFAIVSALLLLLSQSKTAIGLAFVCPALAGIALIIRKITRRSLAIILLSIPICFIVISNVSNINEYRLSYMLYGDSTFTGRAIIWAFAQWEIEQRPLLGWGYQSFWLIGLDAPSVVEAPGFVGQLSEAHSGYYDTKLELGYVGYTLLLIFIISTLHAIGRVADHNPRKALLVLSLTLYVIGYNFLESLWMRGGEFLWVLFLLLAVETARYWGPSPLRGAAYRARRQTSDGLSSPAARMPRPPSGLS
jgi:exopolysaccharide production protein ExoQ